MDSTSTEENRKPSPSSANAGAGALPVVPPQLVNAVSKGDEYDHDQEYGIVPEIVPSGIDLQDDSDHTAAACDHEDGGPPPWEPSVTPVNSKTWKWRDFMYFVGPGWFVCISFVDPGNYQADIQAGATAGYRLLWTIFWTSLFSRLCVRLAYFGQVTLAEVQARNNANWLRYLNWFIAELTAVVTDLPEVIGIGIAGNVFFGWPYWIGVILSLVTTMIFLAMLHFDISKLEFVIFLFVGMMSIALFVEMSFVGVDAGKLFRGWTTDIASATTEDLLSITGILGAVVMPHNLYLHSASCQSRRVIRTEEVVTTVVKYCAWEPVLPIIVSIFVNMAIVSIAAETVYYDKTLSASDAANVGLTDFCEYFRSIRGGCLFWGFALLAAGQSSAVTTTLTGQYIMDGFLKLRLPMWKRAVISRLVAISPCILVSIMFPSGSELNRMVNIVNSSLSLLLPFALTPLVKYNCSTAYMGRYAAGPKERVFMYLLAFSVYFINALSLSTPGGGFFDFVFKMEWGFRKVLWIILQVLLQLFYLCWNLHCILTPVRAPMTPLTQLRPYVEGEFALAPKQAVVAQS